MVKNCCIEGGFTISKTKKAISEYAQEGILAMLPIYHDGGNACRIYTQQNEYEDTRSLRWLLSRTASYYGVDVNLIRRQYGKFLNRRLLNPFPLIPDLVLLPVKMREAIIKEDTTIGYINGLQVSRVEPLAQTPYRSAIHFKSGLYLPCINTVETLRGRLLQGEAVHQEHLRRLGYQSPPPPSLENIEITIPEEFMDYSALTQILQSLIKKGSVPF